MSDYDEYGSCGDDDECPWEDSEEDEFDDEEFQEESVIPEFRDEIGASDRAGKTSIQVLIDEKIDAIKEGFVFMSPEAARARAIARGERGDIQNLSLIMDAKVGVNFPTYDELKHVNVCACMLAWSPRMIQAIEAMKDGNDTLFSKIIKELRQDDTIRDVLVTYLTGEKGLKNIPYILLRYHRWMENWAKRT